MNNLESIIKELESKGIEGIIRRIDELGRMVIPVDYRVGDLSGEITLYLHVVGEYVILSKENENQSGVAREIDGIGRVTIKLETREKVNWEEKDHIAVWCYNGYIIMKKVEEKCVFCKAKKKLAKYMGKLICRKCKSNLVQV